MKMDKKNFAAFRKDFAMAMKPLEEKYGVTISFGSISYTKDDFTTKLSVANGTADEIERREFEENAQYYACYGLTKDDYGRKFNVAGKTYTLIGFSPRSPKNKFTVKNAQGKIYACPATFLNLTKTV